MSTRRALLAAASALALCSAFVDLDVFSDESSDLDLSLLQRRISLAATRTGQPSWSLGCTGIDCLRRYIQVNDSAYTWTITSKQVSGTSSGVGWNAVVIDMTSQSWLSSGEVSETLWRHPLVFIVPDNLAMDGPGADWCSLFVGTLDKVPQFLENPNAGQEEEIQVAAEIAVRTGTRSAVIGMIPYESLIFSNDAFHTERTEDSLVAFSRSFWSLNQDRIDWTIEYPMAKAVIRALDTLQAYSAGEGGGGHSLNHFLVSGHSKRGLTTWRTSLDPRVKAIAPISAPVDMMQAMRRQAESLGGSTMSVHDYIEANQYFGIDDSNDTWRLLTNYAFSNLSDGVMIKEIARPAKLVFQGSSDSFFMPDIWRTGWPQVGGSKAMQMVPNGEHSLDMLEVSKSISSWLVGIIHAEAAPELSWEIDSKTGAITARQISGVSEPLLVRLWQAQTCDGRRRDFRVINLDVGENCTKCGTPMFDGTCHNDRVGWTSSLLNESSLLNGTLTSGRTWSASVKPPAGGGWAAFFLEFEFPRPAARVAGGIEQLERWLTTEVSVVPNTYPFLDCYPHCTKNLVFLDPELAHAPRPHATHAAE